MTEQSEITLRQAYPTDAAAIAEVKNDVWPDESPAHHEHIRTILSARQSTVVAIADNRIAGFADGFPTRTVDGRKRWELDLLAVHTAYHRRGIAGALIRAMETLAREDEAEFIRALVQVNNTPMMRRLEKLAYQPDPQGSRLYVSSGTDASSGTAAKLEAGLIPVETLTYRGVWVEGAITPALLNQAQAWRQQAGLDVVGIITDDPDAETLLKTRGYELVGMYRWWRKTLK